MSFSDRAMQAARKAAESLEREAQEIGALRSLDATNASRWLRDVAHEIRVAAGIDSVTVAEKLLAENRADIAELKSILETEPDQEPER